MRTSVTVALLLAAAAVTSSAQFFGDDNSLTVDINNLPSPEEIHRRLRRQGCVTKCHH